MQKTDKYSPQERAIYIKIQVCDVTVQTSVEFTALFMLVCNTATLLSKQIISVLFNAMDVTNKVT